mgnify:FL=1
MMQKRGVELSINFIVIIILSIIIFGFGVVFMQKLFSQANELRDLTLDDLDARIGSLVCEGSERVCVGFDRKTIKRKEFGVFGLRILNILVPQDFTVTVDHPTGYLGFNKNKDPIGTSNPQLVVLPPLRTVNIARNEERNLGIGIEVPEDAVSGTYILDVKINQENGEPYSNVQKLYVEVP